ERSRRSPGPCALRGIRTREGGENAAANGKRLCAASLVLRLGLLKKGGRIPFRPLSRARRRDANGKEKFSQVRQLDSPVFSQQESNSQRWAPRFTISTKPERHLRLALLFRPVAALLASRPEDRQDHVRRILRRAEHLLPRRLEILLLRLEDVLHVLLRVAVDHREP